MSIKVITWKTVARASLQSQLDIFHSKASLVRRRQAAKILFCLDPKSATKYFHRCLRQQYPLVRKLALEILWKKKKLQFHQLLTIWLTDKNEQVRDSADDALCLVPATVRIKSLINLLGSTYCDKSPYQSCLYAFKKLLALDETVNLAALRSAVSYLMDMLCFAPQALVKDAAACQLRDISEIDPTNSAVVALFAVLEAPQAQVVDPLQTRRATLMVIRNLDCKAAEPFCFRLLPHSTEDLELRVALMTCLGNLDSSNLLLFVHPAEPERTRILAQQRLLARAVNQPSLRWQLNIREASLPS